MQPGKEPSRTKALCHSPTEADIQKSKEASEWGGLPNVAPTCNLLDPLFSNDPWGLELSFQIHNYVSLLDCRWQGATEGLSAVNAMTRLAFSRCLLTAMGGDKTRSWSAVLGHSRGAGRKWQGTKELSRGDGRVQVHNCCWEWRCGQKENRLNAIHVSSSSNRTGVDANLQGEIRMRPESNRIWGLWSLWGWVKFLAKGQSRWFEREKEKQV